MGDEYYTKGDFKTYKKERKNKMPKNKYTKDRKNQSPKELRLSVMGRKIGENRKKIAELIGRIDEVIITNKELKEKMDELIKLLPAPEPVEEEKEE